MAKDGSRRGFLRKAGGVVAAGAVGMGVGASAQENAGGEPPQTLAGQMPAEEFSKFFNDLCVIATGEGHDGTKALPSDDSPLSVMRKHGMPSMELTPALSAVLMPMLTATRSSVKDVATKCSVCQVCSVCDLCAKLNGAAGGASSASLFTLNPDDE